MSALVNPSEIERIVGMQRHLTRHYARAVSTEQTVYILHSHMCVEREADLRDCPYSRALDNGIEESDWSEWEDQAVRVTINRNRRLIPAVPDMRFSGRIW